MRVTLIALAFGFCAHATAAELANEDTVYTLYRDSVVDSAMVIHVATFDSRDGREYNRQNCMIARDLFESQDGVIVNYWCEPGRAK